MKIFSLPYFSNYYITKSGDIYDLSNTCIYHNGNIPPMLIDDNNILHEVRPFHVVYAFYGYMRNGIIVQLESNSFKSKDIYYKIESVKYLSNNKILINNEEFTKINGFEDYLINPYGVIYSCKSNKIIKHNMSKEYRIVTLLNKENPVGISLYVHHLVYETFIGDRPKDRKYVIDHKDNHKWNNYYENLQVISSKENTQKDSDRISKSYITSVSPEVFNINKSYSYSDEFIEHVCQELSNGKSTSQICSDLGITDNRTKNRMISLCYRLRNHMTRSEITSKYNFIDYDTNKSKSDGYKKYDDQIISSIYRMFDAGFSNVQISKLLDIPRQTINKYRRTDNRENKNYDSNEYYIHNRDHINKYDSHTILAIQYLAKNGLGDTEIGRILDIPPNSVHMHSVKVK